MADAVAIRFSADTRAASKGIKDLGKDLQGLEQETDGVSSNMTGAIALITGSVVALGVALVANARDVAALGDEIAKTARTAGLGAKQFQIYAFAAERGGVSQQKMTQGLRVLSRNMLEASQGSKQMADRFANMGIEIQNADGSLRSVDDVLDDVADRVQELGVGTQTTAELMQVMGRSGADLTNVLLDGEEGLRAMREEAESLGGILSDELLQASEEFEDSVTNLGAAFQGVRNELALFVLPALTGLNEKLASTLAGVNSVADAIQGTEAEGSLGDRFMDAIENLAEKVGLEDFAGALRSGRAAERERLRLQERAQATPSGAVGGGAGVGVGGGGGRGRAARPERLTTAGVLNIDPRAVAFTVMMGGSLEDFEAATADVAKMQREMYEEWAANEEMKTAKAAEEAEKRRRIAMETAEAESFAAQQAFGAVATFASIAQQAVEDSYAGQTQAGKTAAKALFITAKLAAIAGATVNTALAITNALANVPAPANIAAAVGVGIAGAAEIGVIAATAIQGVADAGLPPDALRAAGLNQHTVLAVRNDEAVIDPKGTSEITAMLSLQRRQMEMNLMGSANDSRPVVIEMDGRRLTRSLEPHLTRSVEDGSDFRQNVRFAGAL